LLNRDVQTDLKTYEGILPDPKYGSELLAKFMNMIMNDGKKSVAERIIYGALDRIAEKGSAESAQSIEVLEQALENVKPAVEVKSRRRRRCNLPGAC